MSWLKSRISNNTLTYSLCTDLYDKFFDAIYNEYSPGLRHNNWRILGKSEPRGISQLYESSLDRHIESL